MKPAFRKRFGAVALSLSLLVPLGCGGSEPPPRAPSEVGSSGEGAEDDAHGNRIHKRAERKRKQDRGEKHARFPEKCLERKGACLPPIRWAEKLCESVYEDLALYMFRKGTPYTRYYMKLGLNAMNGWGATIDENLVTGEEVIVINHRLRKDTVLVEGSEGTYDVLRWNGSCVTLDMNQVTSRAPKKKRRARIDWRSIDQDYQDVILKDPKVAEIHEIRRKACKGASVGRTTAECQERDGEFLDAVAEFIRNEPDLPAPKKVPPRH